MCVQTSFEFSEKGWRGGESERKRERDNKQSLKQQTRRSRVRINLLEWWSLRSAELSCCRATGLILFLCQEERNEIKILLLFINSFFFAVALLKQKGPRQILFHLGVVKQSKSQSTMNVAVSCQVCFHFGETSKMRRF